MTDSSGHPGSERVPPGEYKVFAWSEVDNGGWFDADFMKQYENRGRPITVREGAASTAQVEAIP